jgi:hypothetical protein
MRSSVLALLATSAMAAPASSILTMKSELNSKINFGTSTSAATTAVAAAAATAATAAAAAARLCALIQLLGPPLTLTPVLPMRVPTTGNAVINSYCKSDLQPSFNRAYSEADVVNSGVVNEITLVLKNVKNSCHGNGGEAPCATDAGADRWPSFVCTFTDDAGQTVNSAAVQAVRNLDIVAGQMLGQEDTVTVRVGMYYLHAFLCTELH